MSTMFCVFKIVATIEKATFYVLFNNYRVAEKLKSSPRRESILHMVQYYHQATVQKAVRANRQLLLETKIVAVHWTSMLETVQQTENQSIWNGSTIST